MAADAHKNFAASLVATAPSPATSGTSLVVTAGDGSKFPAVPFNATIWPASSQPTTANAEIVRVTAVATDTLTITRAQEGTTARTVVVGDQIAAAITAKTLTDIETKCGVHVFRSAALSLANNTVTAIPFDAEVFDTDNFHDLATNTTRLTAPKGGLYLAIGAVRFAASTLGNRGISLLKNGTQLNDIAQPTSNVSGDLSMFIPMPVILSAGDYMEMTGWQNSGSAMGLQVSSTLSLTYFSLTFIGA